MRNNDRAKENASKLLGFAKKIIAYALDRETIARIIVDPDTGWVWDEAFDALSKRMWRRARPYIDPATNEQDYEKNEDGSPVIVQQLDDDLQPVFDPVTKEAVMVIDYKWLLPTQTTMDVCEILESRIEHFPILFGKQPGALLDEAINQMEYKWRLLIRGLEIGAKTALIVDKNLRKDLAYEREGAILQILYDVKSMDAFTVLSTHPKVLTFITDYMLMRLGIKPMSEEERVDYENERAAMQKYNEEKKREMEQALEAVKNQKEQDVYEGAPVTKQKDEQTTDGTVEQTPIQAEKV
jgi:hypothetical protein